MRLFSSPPRLAQWYLIVALSLGVVFPAAAYHEANEPSDGTVGSFKPVKQPTPVPGIKFVNGAGEPVDFSHFRGKIVLINLWATWCPPCIRELPELDRLQARLGGKDFEVAAVAVDREGVDKVKEMHTRLKLDNLALYVDQPIALGSFFPVDVLPANFIMDREGRVIAFLRSFVEWGSPQVDHFFRELMAGKPIPPPSVAKSD